MSPRVRVGSLDQFQAEGSKLVYFNGKQVAFFWRSGRFYALSNICPHQGGPLGEGHIEGDYVICPWHHWDFHLETGKSRLGPDVCVRTYKVEVEGKDVYISPR